MKQIVKKHIEGQYLFIIGSPRSGTTWLQLLLAAHPKIVSSVEQTVFEKYISHLLDVYQKEKESSKRFNKGLSFILTDDEFDRILKSFIHAIYDRVKSLKPGASILLDKNPSNALHIESICSLLPNVKFVHIIRDPRDVVCSMKNVSRKVGHQSGDALQAASRWKHHYLNAKQAKKFDYLEIRYENLIENGVEELKRIFSFLQIENEDSFYTESLEQFKFTKLKASRESVQSGIRIKKGHFHKGKIGTWKKELSNEDLKVIYEEVGQYMLELGYIDTIPQFSKELGITKEYLKQKLKNRLMYLTMAFIGKRYSDKIWRK